MKRFQFSVLLFLMLVFLFGCSSINVNVQQTTIDTIPTLTTDTSATQSSASASANPFEDYENAEEMMNNYHYSSFDLYFSPEEFIKLYEITESISAVPESSINENMFLAYQKIATYNSVTTRYILLTTDGEVLKEYSVDGWGPSDYKAGDFVFISTYDIKDEVKNKTYDVYRSTGEYIRIFKDDGAIYELFDLGNEYHIISVIDNGYNLYVLHPSSEVYSLYIPSELRPVYSDIKEGERAMTVSQLSDGLFSVKYDLILDGTCAFYYDAEGNCIIDLSYVKTNFSVYELGDFINGKAEIKFIGADKKSYTAFIDKTGNFIGEPVME